VDWAGSACALTASQLSTVIDADAGISLHPMPIHKSQRPHAPVYVPANRRRDRNVIIIIIIIIIIHDPGAPQTR